ncbi:MAG: DnaA regulatory inactivator Hda [Betaproteobacteria bacterium]
MNAPAQLALDLVQPLTPRLDNFVPGRNAEALAALRALAAGQGAQFVYLWGEPGCGRSHLLAALAAEGGGLGRAGEVPEFAAEVRLYLVDDVDALDEAGQARFFRLVNEIRGAPGARLASAGSAPPARLALREDVRTRLAWGLVYQLHVLSDVEKAQALLAHAGSRGIVLTPEVRAWMLAHLPRDMRTQVAVLDALDAYALARKRPITLPLLREWLAAGGRADA